MSLRQRILVKLRKKLEPYVVISDDLGNEIIDLVSGELDNFDVQANEDTSPPWQPPEGPQG